MSPHGEPATEALKGAPRHAAILVAVFVLLHTVAVWGHTGLFWGEQGAWLHEIERFAGGELPYRDFEWQRPPLALWLLGGAAMLLGSGLASFGLLTALVAALVLVAYQRFVFRVAPGVLIPAVLAGLLFASAYASRHGPPLPLGSYSPAGPVGVLFLLAGATAAASLLREPRPRPAAGLGIMAALALLSWQALLLPSAYLVVAGTIVLRRSAEPRARAAAGALGAGCGLTLLVAATAILALGGAAGLQGTLAGFLSTDLVSPPMPLGERVVIDVAATAVFGLVGVAALWLTLALDDNRAAALFGVFLLVALTAAATHVGLSVAAYRTLANHGPTGPATPAVEVLLTAVRAGQSPLGAGFGILDQRIQHHFFPALLSPLLLVALLLWWRRWADQALRSRALLLLGLCVAARLPRGLAGADWYVVLLEIPAYAVFLRLLTGTASRQAQRCVSAALSLTILIGLYAYYNLGHGLLTRRHYAAAQTPRGKVRWPAEERADFEAVRRALEEADPSGERPLFAFGISGGWNYYTGRTNPSRLTRGFGGLNNPADTLAIMRHRPAPLLLDNLAALREVATSPYEGHVWEPRSPVAPRARQTFERLAAACREASEVPGSWSRLVLYDCAATPPDSSP